jgi:CHAT domain-containing protein
MLAYYHSKLSNYDLADSFYEKALYLSKKHQLDDQVSDYPSIQMNFGVYQMDEMRNYKFAKSLFFKALSNYMSLYGEHNHNIAICYQNIGEVYYHLELIDSSLYFLQRSLIQENKEFKSEDVYSNPKLDVNKQRPRILNTLKFKATVLSSKYNITRNLKDLRFCLTTYLSIYDYIDQMRLMYDTDDSKMFTAELENETYLNGINIAYKLFDLTGDSEYINTAFQINEKRKVFTLLNSIRSIEAREFGGIPQTLLRDERVLKKRLAAYDELIFEEQKRNKPDKNKIRIWENDRFNTYKLYEDLITTFEEKYPEYYRLKYDASIINVSQIQNTINPNQLLIEYAISDSNIFIFSIGRNSSKIYKGLIDSSFYSSIYFIWDQLTEPNFSSDARKSYQGFCKNSFNLFNILLNPIKDDIENRDLLIVPDGLIWYLPFETLLTTEIHDSDVNYRRLPYLIRNQGISYTYSATVYFEGLQSKRKPSTGLLAFAPDYSNLVTQQINKYSNHLGNYRENLVPIPGVKDEVRSIRRLIEGTIVFLDEEATESNFKKNAENYDILHLAMHALVNNEDPLYSKLAFTQKIDQVEDGFLNTYEIYNSRFNARMAVLSSCKTGAGKLMKGEGVMSLARGFMYAGCPSIVMTLWEVSDKSGARLMEDFYKSLKQGNTKAEALREAKLDFLKSADNLKANPYFWSTYVVIGDSSPLFKKNLNYLYWLAAVLLIGAAGLLFYTRQQRLNRGKETFKPDSMLS